MLEYIMDEFVISFQTEEFVLLPHSVGSRGDIFQFCQFSCSCINLSDLRVSVNRLLMQYLILPNLAIETISRPSILSNKLRQL
jgi:hypothetical protein